MGRRSLLKLSNVSIARLLLLQAAIEHVDRRTKAHVLFLLRLDLLIELVDAEKHVSNEVVSHLRKC
jgi:hypothetical protein